MELYLGINFENHDTAVFFLNPQENSVFGISTERISRFKHDKIFPISAIQKYLDYTKIDANSVKKLYCGNSKVMQKSKRYRLNEYERELFMRELIGEKYLKGYLKGLREFQAKSPLRQSLQLLSKGKLKTYKNLQNSNETDFQINMMRSELKKFFPQAEIIIEYVDHEECHAVSSYVVSPFKEDALLITMDGHGDHNCFSRAYVVKNGEMKQISQSTSPDKFFQFTGKYTEYIDECSIGGMYSYFTYKLGFTPNADEGKVEALAAFGTHENEIYEKLLKCFSVRKENNQIEIIVNKEESELQFSQDEFNRFIKEYKKEDIAAAVQKFLEVIMMEYINGLIEISDIRNLCFSGGIFANVILNLRVFEEITPHIHIVPAMADDGSAEGACYKVYLNNQHKFEDLYWIKDQYMPYYGTSYSREEILKALQKNTGTIKFEDFQDTWPEKAAALVAEGKVGALFHGRMEWGPRALGNRSIVADCRDSEITKKINGSIKNRPLFQPFCPSILEEDRDRLFEKSYPNKHMTCAFRMRQENIDKIPASVHVDGTGRAQFVEEADNPMYYRYLKELKRLTGFGVSINTSFNKHGRTIVETPDDAIRDFLDTNMDFVMIEGYLITR